MNWAIIADLAAFSSLASLRASSRWSASVGPASVDGCVSEQIDERSVVAVQTEYSVLSCHQTSLANKKGPDRDFRS